MNIKEMDLVFIREACETLGLCREVVKNLAKAAGALIRFDRTYVVDMNRLMAYLDSTCLINGETVV